jgi:hypothetical protein
VPLGSSAGAKTTVASKWSLPSSNYVSTFSAVAYLLGLQLQQGTHVPIGIVQSSYGGQIAPLSSQGLMRSRASMSDMWRVQCRLASGSCQR